jgi:hypothetical protein
MGKEDVDTVTRLAKSKCNISTRSSTFSTSYKCLYINTSVIKEKRIIIDFNMTYVDALMTLNGQDTQAIPVGTNSLATRVDGWRIMITKLTEMIF